MEVQSRFKHVIFGPICHISAVAVKIQSLAWLYWKKKCTIRFQLYLDLPPNLTQPVIRQKVFFNLTNFYNNMAPIIAPARNNKMNARHIYTTYFI